MQSEMRTWQPCGKQMRPNWCAGEAKCCTIRSPEKNQEVRLEIQKARSLKSCEIHSTLALGLNLESTIL